MNNKVTEATVYGDEPIWEGCDSWSKDKIDQTFVRAIQWYNYMSDDRDHRKWLIEYCKNNKIDKVVIEKLSKLDDINIKYGEIPGEIKFTTGIYARLINLGAKIDDNIKSDFDRYLNYLINKSSKISLPEEVSVKPSVKERSISKSHDINNLIEQMGDQVLTTGKIVKETDLKLILTNKSIKKDQASIILPEWENKKSSFNIEDYDLSFSKENIDRYLNFINLTINVLSQISSEKRVIIRKRRSKPATDQVKKMQYLKEDTSLKITSILPSKIVGSSKVVLYNTKYKRVTILEAGNSVGFTVKGTTIYGFDDTKSYAKSLTKNVPATLKDMQTKGIRAVKLIIDGLKGKKYPAKGKTNEFTIIVGVY